MVVSPEGLLAEGASLRYEHGIIDAFGLLTVDEDALCATPFHGNASRLKELARGDHPRGTVGSGIGQAYRDFRVAPEYAIYAGDLKRPGLRDKLAVIRDRVRADLASLLDGEFLAADREEAAYEIALLADDQFLDYAVKKFEEAGRLTNVVSRDYMGEVILNREGVAVVETSHGVLSDRLVGFHPHTSALRTLPSFTQGMLRDAGYEGEIVNLGICRAYAIRHGAGPMPTVELGLGEDLLPGSNKDENRYQGKVRVGPFDFVTLRYAIEACGGPDAFDGLAITWFDQVKANGAWAWCDTYDGADDPAFFTREGEIRYDPSFNQAHQEALTKKLAECRPVIQSQSLDPTATNDELYTLCADRVQGSLGVPVRMMSFGPTEIDKLYR